MFDFDYKRQVEANEYEIPINLSIENVVSDENDKLSYGALKNKPTLNGKTIIGNMTNEDLGIPTKTSDLENDDTYLTEQEQSDWDENDTESPAYIKNRPFYINNRIEDKSILGGNYTVQRFTEIGLGYKAETDTLLIAYDKYKITWDGTTYYMTALPAGGTRVFIGDINTEPYFRIETYQTTEGDKYIMIDYPSDADAVHSIYLTSLTSEPVSTQEFDNYIISLVTASADSAIADKSKIIDGNVIRDAIYLRSSNKIWKITINDSGELNTTEI